MRYLNNKTVTAINADFNSYIYTKVYASADATPTINGTVVTMAGGSSIKILVKFWQKWNKISISLRTMS